MKLSNCLQTLIFFLLLNGHITLSKRLLNDDISSSLKLNQCQRCKVLTDSFEHWLEKTSRGKFEGGDAAWEEAKLKSYARSEIRLVEVQEGLCSELKRNQDYCYSLAEEAEQPLEKWWFYEDPLSTDLYTWLCIDTLKYCCPDNHYGEKCDPCPLDVNKKICSSHGRCDGAGTRAGKGTCMCDKGYIGLNCQECDKNFYENVGLCKPCHKACNGCTGSGSNTCKECKQGWRLESSECIDVDECRESTTCIAGQYCVNREGSHVCKICEKSCKTCIGAGPSNCTLCDEKHVLWNGMCLNEEENVDLLFSAVKRSILYSSLFLITTFMLRKSGILASMVILIVSIFIFYSEKNSKMKVLEALYITFFS